MANTITKKRMTPKIKKEVKDLKRVLDNEKQTLTTIQMCKERTFELIKAGYEIEGYDVTVSLGNRMWKKGVTVEKLFNAFSKIIKKKKDYQTNPKPELKSPAQFEKYFIELAAEKVKLKKFTEQLKKGDKLTRLETE